MKKVLLFALIAALALNSVFANGSSESASSDGRTQVTVALWAADRGDRLERSEAEFEASHPDIDINFQVQSGDYSNYLGAKTAANDLADIYLLTPYAQVKTFAQAGRIQDLSDAPFVSEVYPESLESASYEGKVYGYPANYEFLGVYYNRDIFEACGITEVPTTRSEFIQVCETLQANGYQPIASTFKESWTLKHLFSILLTTVVQDDIPGFIDSLNSGDGTFNVDGIDEVFAFADILSKYSGANYKDMDSTSGYNALANGSAAMLISGEFSLSALDNISNPPDIGLFAVPVSENPERNKLAVDVGQVFVVNAKPDNQEATMEVLDFLSDGSLENGYVAIMSNEIGSAPPAMPFNFTFECQAYADYLAYADAGNTVPWVYQQFANGFDVVSGDIFQAYVFGAKDQATVLSELDEAYKTFI